MFASINTMPCDPVPAFPWPTAGHRNFSTTFPSRKNRRSLRCATQLQAEYCVRLEHDPHVERYWPQPHVFSWEAGADRFRYAPHFLIENDDGGGHYCEVQVNLDSTTARRRDTLLAFAELCREQGWRFYRIAPDAVLGPTFTTLQKLYLRSLDSSPDQLKSCLQLVTRSVWPATIRDVLNTLPAPSLPALCGCLFSGHLYADLSQTFDLDLIIQGPARNAASV